MTRTPTTSSIYKELLNLEKRVEALQSDVNELKSWRRTAEEVKKAIQEYQELHPEVKDKKDNSVVKALIAVTAVIGILGAVIVTLAQS